MQNLARDQLKILWHTLFPVKINYLAELFYSFIDSLVVTCLTWKYKERMNYFYRHAYQVTYNHSQSLLYCRGKRGITATSIQVHGKNATNHCF